MMQRFRKARRKDAAVQVVIWAQEPSDYGQDEWRLVGAVTDWLDRGPFIMVLPPKDPS